MKALICVIVLVLLPVSIVVQGCGEDTQISENVDRIKCYTYSGVESYMRLNREASTVITDTTVWEITAVWHGTLLRVDSVGLQRRYDLMFESIEGEWALEDRVERWIDVIAKYRMDSITHDTVCYERRDCEEGK